MGMVRRIKVYSKAVDVTTGIKKNLKENYGFIKKDIRDVPPDVINSLIVDMMNHENHN